MKNKVLFILPLMILFSLVLSLGFISSAGDDITIENPLESAVLSGGASMLNSTIEAPTGAIYNVTFYHNQSGTLTAIGTVTNTSDAQASFNRTWDTTSLVDTNFVTINATARNLVNGIVSSDATELHPLDNGLPTATLSSATFTDNLALVTGTTFTIGIDADATIGVSSCKVYYTSVLSSAVIESTATASGNACTNSTTPTAVGLAINEAYTVIIEATDGNTNSTNATARTLRVTPGSVGGGSGGGSSATPQSITTGTTTDSTIQSIGFFQRIANFFRNLFSRK